MIEIYDPIDPGNDYGLILYEYQRTGALIEKIVVDHYNDDSSRLNELPELFKLHKKQLDDFFDSSDHEELIKQYVRSCADNSFTKKSIIDIGLNRSN